MKRMLALTLAVAILPVTLPAQETPSTPGTEPPTTPTRDPAAAPKRGAAAQPKRVESDLAAIDTLLAKGNWAQARDRVLKLLTELGPCDELAPHADRLDDALRAATFEIDYAKLGLGDMVAGAAERV